MDRHAYARRKAAATFAIIVAIWMLASPQADAQAACSELGSGLEAPLALARSNKGNLLVSEGGARTPNTGRISVVDRNGNRRTLIDGLPSGIADVGDVSGPAGLFIRGRTLYAVIGVGDVGVLGRNAARQPIPGSNVPNPNGLSSPILSSVLAIHFSADVEKSAVPAFTLARDHHDALSRGEKVTLTNADGRRIAIELVTDFEDYVPFPHPAVANNVKLSNPFGIVAVGDRLYVTDGGRNKVWAVAIPTGVATELAAFANIANPLFPSVGPPTSEAVPTGIAYSDGRLLVTLFRGSPFAAGTSSVEAVDPLTGNVLPFITGLKTAIGVLPVADGNETGYLVLQHSSGSAPFFNGPGLVLDFGAPNAPPTQVASCLVRPSAMTLDERTGTLYVTEAFSGRLVSIALVP